MPKAAEYKALDTVVDLAKRGFKPFDTAQPRHFAAMGRFLTSIANYIDVPLSSCLQMQIASSEDGVTRILVGNMPVGDVMGAIRRMAVLRGSSGTLIKEINDLFGEIDTLRGHRNNVAHRVCMISGSKMAFHNANTSKTDEMIDVSIYTIKELDEFADYAKLLGYRISLVNTQLIPDHIPPIKEALLVQSLHRIQMTLIKFLIDSKVLSRPKLEEIKRINADAHQAVSAYTDATRLIDPEYAAKKKSADGALKQITSFLTLFGAPQGDALREIPRRLQKSGRARPKNTAPKRPRQPPPFQA